LRLIRAILNISDLEAAAAAGVSKQTWHRWEISGRPGQGILNFIYAPCVLRLRSTKPAIVVVRSCGLSTRDRSGLPPFLLTPAEHSD
jgi:hypothetical protein